MNTIKLFNSSSKVWRTMTPSSRLKKRKNLLAFLKKSSPGISSKKRKPRKARKSN
jgi:hypothetical protein